MTYRLYIDESGDTANPINESGDRKLRSSMVFCLGGILVDETQKQFFEMEHKRLLSTYFTGIDLGENFKLHYNPLRMNLPPYSNIGRARVLELEDEVFRIIQKSHAVLFSFTIDLENHYQKYARPINPLAYGLNCMLERLLYYMEDNDIDSAGVVYERFTHSLRDVVRREQKYLVEETKFKTKPELHKLFRYIKNGDPTKEPVLQFADFWTYLPYIEEKSSLELEKKFSEQYYNYNKNTRRGKVRIR